MQIIPSRRDSLAGASWAAAAGVLGPRGSLAGEPPPEVTTIRLARTSGSCVAPIYIAEELLRAEGFVNIRYLAASGEADFLLTFAAPLAIPIDAGQPLTVIAGAHIGCFELVGNDTVRHIADLKGKSVGVQAVGSSQHVFLASKGKLRRARPQQGYQLGHESIRQTEGTLRGRQDRRDPWLSARA